MLYLNELNQSVRQAIKNGHTLEETLAMTSLGKVPVAETTRAPRSLKFKATSRGEVES